MNPDAPLRVTVESNRLIISIGIGTLARSFDASDWNNQFSDQTNQFKRGFSVTDPFKFASEVARALENEDEVGATLVTDLLDQACQSAVENGALGVDEIECD